MLQGVGAAVALPFLDAMRPAFGAASPAPVRMAYLYVPNGIVMEEWIPKTEVVGAIPLPSQLPRITSALSPYRDDLMMLSGLTSNGGRALGDGPGDHGRAGAAYLTGVHPKKTSGKDIQTGISMDQVAAQKLEGKTRFSSLELGCEEGIQGGNCDNGYSCAYSNSISWRTPSSPMPPEIHPRAVFERLFGPDLERDPKRRARRELYEKSILDVVLDDARRLQSSVGGADRRKLDEYLSSIREVEMRIQRTERDNAQGPPAAGAPPASIPTDFGEHARIMMDLLALAFQTDMTRVSTVLLGIEQSHRSYGAEIGIPEAHHGLTHHSGDKEKIEKVTRINCYHMQQFTYLLDKLKGIPEGEGTLLDHCMIAYGAGLSDGNRHEHHNLPLILAGRANGSLKPGRIVRYPDETPITNLYVTMLDKLGVHAESLGDSTGSLGYLSDL
jgi:hypothetical protein